ncbi:MAG: electron transporter RnfD [Lachnotalea sp.]
MSEKRIEMDNELLQYSGRIDFTNKKEPIMIYPCSSVTLKFTGTTLKIILRNKNIYWDNYLGYIIDGKQEKVLLTNEQDKIITLADNLKEEEHLAIIFKRMDSCHAISLLGICINENGRLLQCDDKPNRKIEFYGDSVSAGEVSEAVEYVGKPDPSHKGEYSNSWYSYAWLTARKLNAQIHNVSQGGIALLNGTGWFYENNYTGIESTYDKMSYHPELGEITNWNFAEYVPHVIIIAIGQNDSHPVDYMKEEYNGEQGHYWRESYENFVRNIRVKNPNSVIILTTTILQHHVNWDNSIEEVCNKLKDRKIMHFLYSENGCKTPGHIRISEAEQMSDELVGFINSINKELLLW